MLPRLVGVPVAAIVVLVAAPGLVVRTISPPASRGVVVATVTPAKAKAASPEATLKIGVTGGAGGKRALHLNVLAAGSLPTKPASLADEAGLHAATVTPVHPRLCKGRPVHRTLVGTQPWCLAVTGADAGHELTGTIVGGTKLMLTVTRRDGSCWPILVLALGIAAAFGIAAFTKALERFVGRLRIADVLDRNSRAGADRIIDLDDWTNTQLDQGTSVGTVLATISGMVKTGVRQVKDGRAQLANALAATPLPGSPAYFQGAHDEAQRTDLRPLDFVDDAGHPKPVRAAEWLAGLPQLKADATRLTGLSKDVETMLEPGCRDAPRAKVVHAQTALMAVDKPEGVAGMTTEMTEAQAAYNTASETPGCLKVPEETATGSARAGVDDYLRMSGMGGDLEPIVLEIIAGTADSLHEMIARARSVAKSPIVDLRGKRLWRDEWFGKILTAAAVAAAVVFAGATVWEAAYEAKPAFAGFADYFALFSAALASGAAASVLSLLAYWRPQPST